MTGPQSLTIMNRSVPSGTHICAFCSGPAGRDDVDSMVHDHRCYIDPGEFLRGAE